jgi:hypothetical protein
MMTEIIVQVAGWVIVVVGVIIATLHKPSIRKTRWMRFVVIAAATLVLLLNVLTSSGYLRQIDRLTEKMDLLNSIVVHYFESSAVADTAEPDSVAVDTVRMIPAEPASGNVAGYVRDSEGRPIQGVTITRLVNNAQTTSFRNGEFIVPAKAGEEIRFWKDGYSDLVYKVDALDFTKVVEVVMKEE